MLCIILQSYSSPQRFYVEFTDDLKHRIKDHNAGKSTYTNKYTPWRLGNYIAFDDKNKALMFELYFKSGAGRIFVKKHL